MEAARLAQTPSPVRWQNAEGLLGACWDLWQLALYRIQGSLRSCAGCLAARRRCCANRPCIFRSCLSRPRHDHSAQLTAACLWHSARVNVLSPGSSDCRAKRVGVLPGVQEHFCFTQCPRMGDFGLRELTSHHDQHEGGCVQLEQLHALLARHLRPHQLIALYERGRGSNPPAQACSSCRC